MRSQRTSEGWIDGHVFAYIRRADFVQAQTAVLGGNLESEQIEVGRLLQQLTRLYPVMCVEARLVGQHLVAQELRRGPAEQTLFVGQILAREELIRIQRPDQECAASAHLLFLSR